MADDVDRGEWEYAVERKGSQWQHVPMPADLELPSWTSDNEEIAVAQTAPAGDRVAFVRPGEDEQAWVLSSGAVIIADADGSNERVVAKDGENPNWSPDGKHLAFTRCHLFEERRFEDEYADRATECSLWTVRSDGAKPAELLVEKAASTGFWSPDGRFIAFFRRAAGRETFRRFRIFIVPSKGGDAQEVGPELVEPSVEPWPGLVWLSEGAPVVVPAPEDARADDLELQRCVDIWNRARMSRWPSPNTVPPPNGAVNVSLVGDRCQVTLRYYGGVCTQAAEMQFRFWCPSHGAPLDMLPPEFLVWNAHRDREGELRLFDPPKGPRLPLPKSPQHPLLDGFVVPYDEDGEALPELKLTDAAGTCSWYVELSDHLGSDGYPMRCWWGDDVNDHCFKRPGALKVGDFALCPDYRYMKRYDPLAFFKVAVTSVQ